MHELSAGVELARVCHVCERCIELLIEWNKLCDDVDCAQSNEPKNADGIHGAIDTFTFEMFSVDLSSHQCNQLTLKWKKSRV